MCAQTHPLTVAPLVCPPLLSLSLSLSLSLPLAVWFGPSNVAPTLTAPPGAGANTLCANLPGDLTYQSNVVPCVGSGRYVWLYLPPAPTPGRYIILAEFQVLQRQPWVWRKLSGFTNVAYLANAFASSVYFNGNQAGDPMYLTDGALSNVWPSQAGTTDRVSAPLPDCNNVHMTVDLGATFSVQGVALWPRTDCCRARSKRIEIYVGNSRDWKYNRRVLSSADIENPTAGAGQGTYFPNSCPAATYGTLAKAAFARGAGWFARRCARTCISPRLSAFASWPAGLTAPVGAPDTVLAP